MAAHAFLKRLAENGGLDHYQVTVIGDEPRPCYDRVNLTDFFSGRSSDDLLLSPREWYEEHEIDLVIGALAERIDRTRRVVVLESGRELPYQQLVLATGSRPFVPPIEGTDLPGVFVYRTIEDLEQIRDYASGRASAAVLGGGLLGLEAAKALHDLGLETHVAEVAPGLMPRQLNAEAATLLREEIESLGVSVHLLRRAERIEPHGESRVLHFAGHDPLRVDMVVVSAGIRPRSELASEAGLDCCERGAIAVDPLLRTKDPKVHAIGECVSLDGALFGLVGPCYEMATVVADSLQAQAVGQPLQSKFSGGSTAARLKLMGVDVATLGLAIGEAPGATPVVSRGDGFCRTLLVEKNRLVGAIGVGPWPEREMLNDAITRRRRFSDRHLERFKDSGLLWPNTESLSVSQWPAGATVCSCLNVSRGQLSAAMSEGAADADALAAATGASTVCGSCRDLLCELAGQAGDARPQPGRKKLLVGSCVALMTLVAIVASEPIAAAETVQSSWRAVDRLWRESFARQITGFTLLAISLGALALSLRKRFDWLRLGDFASWRGVHGLIGATTIIGFLVHTGMRLGHNFTLALACVFLLLNLLGAFSGLAAALETSATGVAAQRLRAWRPRLVRLHLWLFWPLPVLVLFHIISVYYY